MKTILSAKIMWHLPFMPDQGFAVDVGHLSDLTVTRCSV